MALLGFHCVKGLIGNGLSRWRGTKSCFHSIQDRLEYYRVSLADVAVYLKIDHFAVDRRRRIEVVVISGSCYASVIEEMDLIGILDRGKTMGDDERSPSFHELVQGELDPPFRLGIEG